MVLPHEKIFREELVRIDKKSEFHGYINSFTNCLQSIVGASGTMEISWRKLFCGCMATKPRNLWQLSLSKVSRYNIIMLLIPRVLMPILHVYSLVSTTHIMNSNTKLLLSMKFGCRLVTTCSHTILCGTLCTHTCTQRETADSQKVATFLDQLLQWMMKGLLDLWFHLLLELVTPLP